MVNTTIFAATALAWRDDLRIDTHVTYPSQPSPYKTLSIEVLKNAVLDSSYDKGRIDRMNTDKDPTTLSPDELRQASDAEEVALYNALVSTDGKTWTFESALANDLEMYITPLNLWARSQMIEKPEVSKTEDRPTTMNVSSKWR